MLLSLQIFSMQFLFFVGPISNLHCDHVSNQLLITWNASVEGECSGSPLNYTVTITKQDNDSNVYQYYEVNTNRIEIPNVLEPSQNYSISVASKVRGSICENEASVLCETGRDLPTGE